MARARFVVTFAALIGAGLLLSACESMDSFTDKLDIFNLAEKRKLQGERKPVFPEGVPGVAQGIPPEMVKGYQPPPEAAPAPEPEQKSAAPVRRAKPVVANKPTRLTVQPERQKPDAQQPDDQPQQAPRQ